MGRMTRTVKSNSAGGRKRTSTGHFVRASERFRRAGLAKAPGPEGGFTDMYVSLIAMSFSLALWPGFLPHAGSRNRGAAPRRWRDAGCDQVNLLRANRRPGSAERHRPA